MHGVKAHVCSVAVVIAERHSRGAGNTKVFILGPKNSFEIRAIGSTQIRFNPTGRVKAAGNIAAALGVHGVSRRSTTTTDVWAFSIAIFKIRRVDLADARTGGQQPYPPEDILSVIILPFTGAVASPRQRPVASGVVDVGYVTQKQTG